MKRPSILPPLMIGLALMLVWRVLVWVGPVEIGELLDAREVLFGERLKYLKLLKFLGIGFLIVATVRLITFVLFDSVLVRRRKVAVPQLLRQIAAAVLYVVLFSLLISSFFPGVPIRGLLASGTIVAAVLALALQDTLGNLFAGIALHVESAFEVGDVVRSGTHVGVVEGVNWRAARLRTLDNNTVVLPNSVIAREHLEVFRRGRAGGRRVTVRVAYEIPPGDVIAVLDRAIENVPGISHDFAPHARLSDFGESAAVYEIRYWLNDYQQREKIDAEIRRVVWYALRRNGYTIPFPIRTVYMAEQRKSDSLAGEAEIRRRLSGIDLLDVLTAEQKLALADSVDVVAFSRGETIIRHGDEGSSMFVVHRGQVSVRLVQGSRTDEVAQLSEGSVFGEMALLTGASRTADVVAITDVVLLRIEKDALQPLLEQAPELADALSRRMIERRADLSLLHDETGGEAETTLMSKIRSWFGIR